MTFLFELYICSILEEHKGHNFIILEDSCNSKITDIKKDTDEMVNFIFPTYEEIRNELESHIAGLDGEYEKLAAILEKNGITKLMALSTK